MVNEVNPALLNEAAWEQGAADGQDPALDVAKADVERSLDQNPQQIDKAFEDLIKDIENFFSKPGPTITRGGNLAPGQDPPRDTPEASSSNSNHNPTPSTSSSVSSADNPTSSSSSHGPTGSTNPDTFWNNLTPEQRNAIVSQYGNPSSNSTPEQQTGWWNSLSQDKRNFIIGAAGGIVASTVTGLGLAVPLALINKKYS